MKKRTKTRKALDAMREQARSRSDGGADIPSDVNGSYTGLAEDGSHPVQDADDL